MLALAWSVVSSPGGAADLLDSRADEEARWTPSIALTSGVTWGKQWAAVASQQVSVFPPVQLRDTATGNDWSVAPYFGGNIELLTPTIPRVPGRLRAFVVGEFLPTFSALRQIAKDSDPSGFVVPPGDPALYPEERVLGDGSATESILQTWSYAAALGIAYPMEVKGHVLRVKPMVAWYRYGVDIEGRVLEAIKDDPPLPPPFGSRLRLIELVATGSQTFDTIGPGLEFELDAGRFGQLRPTIYLDLYAYRLITDPDIELVDNVTMTDAFGGPDTYRARWYFKVDDWLFRGGAGVRVRWVGKQ